MIINIDEKQVEISEAMIQHLIETSVQDVVQKYKETEPTFRIGIKTALRTWVFPKLEKALKIPVRPPKEVDPVVFLIDNIANIVQKALQYAAIDIKTDESDGSTYRPTAFRFTIKDSSESGRQLAFNWEEGKR